jgi:soluble lytic murein transglycosylase-like protein
MRANVSILFLAVFLASVNVYGQIGSDPFADSHRDILDAAARETAAVRQQNTPAERPRTDVPAESISTLPDSGLERFRELKPLLSGIFEEYGVPQDFLLVGLVESGYRPDAISSANAVGMWQFMESTARRFGLIDRTGDHRTDVIRSTYAAAAYLKFLLAQYKDWRLALAAYNAGEERVDQAISVAGSADFSVIARRMLLPPETLSYVPAVLKRMAEARSAGLLQSGN